MQSLQDHPVPQLAANHCLTGVAGLDDVLAGGFRRNRFYLLQGRPGVGKTTLALQFLLEGRRLGEKGLYITLSETKEELTEVAHSHEWSLDGISLLEFSAVEQQLVLESQNTLFHPSEVELRETTKVLMEEVERVKPVRVVLDSLSEIRHLAQNPLRYRRQFLALKQFFIGRNCTVLLLDDGTFESGDTNVQSLAHGVISLEQIAPGYGTERRRLQVVKMRGVNFRSGYHDYTIKIGGIEVYPRLVASEHEKNFERIELSSGLASFDALLDGGITTGTSTLIMGPAGTGKSTLAAQFAFSAAGRGQKSLIFIFDESVATLLARCRAVSIDLDRYVDSGVIRVVKVNAAEISPSELVHNIRNLLESDPEIRLVSIDSMNGYLNAMISEKFLPLQLLELLTYLNDTGIATILTLVQHGMVGQELVTPLEVTYLADTVVLLRYFESRGAVKRALSVVKKRSGHHELTIREYSITKAGIVIGEPLKDFHGVLTGVPVYTGESSNLKKV